MFEKIKQVTETKMQEQTLYQLTQIKTFVDTTLKGVASLSFEKESDKISYLLDTLYNIRDFVLTQNIENSVRLSLIKQFEEIENQQKLGNDLQLQKEKSSEKISEKLAQNQESLETNEA